LASENLESLGYREVVCVIIRLAVLVEHRLVIDGRTDRRTDKGPWLVPQMHSIAR